MIIYMIGLNNLKRNKMNKETVKEGALRIIPDKSSFGATERSGFIKGVKWQQERSYSEEEVFIVINKLAIDFNIPLAYRKNILEWFEQFKKK